VQFSPGWCRGWQMRVVIARQVHMRIPVSFSDHAEVFPRQIELLRQRFAPTLGVDAPYADFFAKLMGYSSYDDLLEARVENVLEHSPSVTRYALHEGMIWNAFSQGCCSYLDACGLIDLLDYELFDCTLLADAPYAAISTSTSSPGLVSKDNNHAKKRKFSPFSPENNIIVINSMGYDQDRLRERSRELVEAGAPKNEVTIFDNGRGFCWGRVREVIRLLPSDFDDRLSRILGYIELDDSLSRRMKFWREEVVSPLHEPGWAVVKRNRVIPQGFETVLNNGSAYLYNKVLQGYIPYSFAPESQYFFEAIVQILSGKVVSFDELELKSVDELGFRKVYLEKVDNLNVNPDGKLVPLGRTVKSIPVKLGEIFYENWQPYLRAQRWIKPSDLSEQVFPRCAAKVIHPDRLSPLAVPTWHSTFTAEIRSELDENVASSIEDLEQLLKNGELEKIVNNLATYCVFDLDQLIRNRVQKMSRSNPGLSDKRGKSIHSIIKAFKDDILPQEVTFEAFVKVCEAHGSNIKKSLPGLCGFSNLSLGWVYHKIDEANKSGDPVNSSENHHAITVLAVIALLASCVENIYRVSVTANTLAAALFGLTVLINGLTHVKKNHELTGLQKTSVDDMSTLSGYNEFLMSKSNLSIQESNVADIKCWRLNEAQRSESRNISGKIFTDGEVSLNEAASAIDLYLGGESTISDNCVIGGGEA